MESSLLNSCCEVRVVVVVESLLWNLCCGIFGCGIFVVESLMWSMYCWCCLVCVV